MNVAVTINGKVRYVRDRTSVFEACREANVYIPHFCYHPKLSIPANCRMCLVQVGKAPKPIPACATMVTDGMIIKTNSATAANAQRGVMEFLLINHPLDCPICDQGGECQLQDLAVGYGSSCTRYGETKRVVVEKNLGPLINTVMTRCIHCTRCVRFGQEVAGQMELGMIGRGEHAEIMPFIASTVDSELSGNMVDVCPVGALNSKPFRFSARTWELKRTEGIAQQDSWGSMIKLQSKDELLKRVLPLEYEEINECWLSDRDRYAYTGMHVPQRLLLPHVLDQGASQPRQVDWQQALEVTRTRLQGVIKAHGPEQIGVLIGTSSVSEEGLIAEQFIRGLGSNNIDHRLRQRDFRLDGQRKGVPWLGCSIEELHSRDHILLVGSNPNLELPLLPVRLRRGIAEHTTAVSSLAAVSLRKYLQLKSERLAAPSQWVTELAMLCCAAGDAGTAPAWMAKLESTDWHRELATQLREAKAPAVLLGAQASHTTDYSLLRQLAQLLAKRIDGLHGVLIEGPNTAGLALAGVVPHHGFMLNSVAKKGLHTQAMLAAKLSAYILVNCEPNDFIDPLLAHAAFANATTIAIGGYADSARTYADVMLPAALYAERMGSMVNLEGNALTMKPAVMPPAEARPPWKIFRVLGNMFALDGFDYEDIDEVRVKLINAGNYTEMLINGIEEDLPIPAPKKVQAKGFERVPELAHFSCDQLLRRAGPLQETGIALRENRVRLHPDDLAELGLPAGDDVELVAGDAHVICEVEADELLMRGCVRAPWGADTFVPLGGATHIGVQAITLLKVSAPADKAVATGADA